MRIPVALLCFLFAACGPANSFSPDGNVRDGSSDIGSDLIVRDAAVDLEMQDGIIDALMDVSDAPIWPEVAFDSETEVGPTRINGIEYRAPIIQMSIAPNHGCFVLADHSAWCYGDNSQGMLGSGDQVSREVPVRLPIKQVLQIETELFHTCALTGEGQVFCWGREEYGEVSGIIPKTATARSLVPTRVDLLGSAVRITVASTISCAILEDRTVWCWGNTGLPSPPTDTLGYGPPRVVPGVRDAVDIAARYGGGCSSVADGGVWCWGICISGSCGNAMARNLVLNSPMPVIGMSDAVSIRSGGTILTCAIRRDRSVWCWGPNDFCELGLHAPDRCTCSMESFDCAQTPIRMPFPGPVAQLALGFGTPGPCALLRDGTVWCWGRQPPRAVGPTDDGIGTEHCVAGATAACRYVPAQVADLSGVVELSGCARQRNQQVVCWNATDGVYPAW